MKLLLDACMWSGTATDLRSAGHDVLCAADWPQPVVDGELFRQALADGRLLITIDRDLGETEATSGLAQPGILRIVNFSVRRQTDVCIRVLGQNGQDLAQGASVTVRERGREGRQASPWQVPK